MIPRPLALLLDATTYLYRAYFARRSLVGRDGSQVNAVYGFMETLLALLEEWQPEYAAAAFDDPITPTFRERQFPAYKQARPQTPDRLLPQFELAREAAQLLGFTPPHSPGYEAEDILATLVRRFSAQGLACLVVGTDKDLAQLVRDGVWLYPWTDSQQLPSAARPPTPGGAGLRPAWSVGSEARGPGDPPPRATPHDSLSRCKLLDAAAVQQRYGVLPKQIPDLLALGGDRIDGLPGVPGIGQRMARRLLATGIPLETLRSVTGAPGERPEPLTPGHSEGQADCFTNLGVHDLSRAAAALRDGWDAFQHGRELATLRDDVPLDLPEHAFRRRRIDPDAVRSYCDRFGFDQLRDRIFDSPATR